MSLFTFLFSGFVDEFPDEQVQVFFRHGSRGHPHLSAGSDDDVCWVSADVVCFKQQDIVNLPNFHGYARMNLTNEVMRPFSFHTELCDDPVDAELGEKILQFSRQRYGQEAKDIDEEIKNRDMFWKKQLD